MSAQDSPTPSAASQQSAQTHHPDEKRVNVRKVVTAPFISLDGVTEAPDQWQFDHFDEDMLAAMSAAIADEDAVLMGRRTYEEWSAYWPGASDEPYASHINSVQKYVVSTTLDAVNWGQWNNVALIKGNLADEIARLKQQPGKNIGVAGSVTLVRSLLRANLLDELTLLVHPVIAGRGERLFDNWDELKRMALVGSATTRTGVAILTYRPRESN